MSADREDEAKALFAAARSWNPVDRAMLDRVAARLESKPRRPPLVPLAIAVAATAAILYVESPREMLADPPARSAAPKFVAKRLKREALLAPKPRAKPAPIRPLIVEQPAPKGVATPPAPVAEKTPPPRRRYVPRAIAEFQQLDWQRLQENDELPAYIQSIIVKRDRRALLAALDRMPLDRELRLVRGALRADEARCEDAIADFDAVLHDDGARELHPRAASARDRCR